MRDRRTRPKRIPQHQERFGRVAITGAIMSTQSSVHFYLNWVQRADRRESLAAKNMLHIAVVGGGATGVELAAELILLTEIAAYYGAAGLRDQVKVTLLESGPQLLRILPASSTMQRLVSLTDIPHSAQGPLNVEV
jgi:NADH dehydrogenase FAD-containing subunit